jgi:hypothetical protein
MSRRALCSAVAVTALLVPWLAPSPAPAQDFDAPRLRSGVGLNGGGMLSGGAASYFGAGGIAIFQIQVGTQVGDHVAVYAMPEVGPFYGRNGWAWSGGVGAMAEYTFDSFSLGGGPDAGVLCSGPLSWPLTEVFVGPRIHGAFYPVVVREDGGVHRRGLFLGVDLGVYWPVHAGGFVSISPTVSVGYQRF